MPFYAGLRVGRPQHPRAGRDASPMAATSCFTSSRPGPPGIGAALAARIGGTPICGSYHTELAAYAGAARGRPEDRGGDARGPLDVLRPVRGGALAQPGHRRIACRARDRARAHRPLGPRRRYSPCTSGARRDPGAFPGEVKVLYAGRLTKEKGSDLLAESFLRAHERDPRLHLLLAGGGPEEDELRERLGDARHLPRLARPSTQLAHAYASSDIFLFCSPDRHLRPGDRRGAGQRPAGRGGQRGRPRLADRGQAHRLALRARRRGARVGRRPARRVRRSCGSA